MLITDAAVFYSRLTKWDDRFAGLPPHAVSRQLYFRLAFDTDVLTGNVHHLIVDIAATLQAKIDSVMCYQTQFEHKPYIADRLRAAALMTGTLAGVSAGESFAAAKPSAIDDLVKTLMF